MKLRISCVKCIHEKKYENKNDLLVEINDDDIYRMVCNHGHQTILFLHQHRFEVLFDMGIYALIDGYVREAVTSFAASLERFHEFCIDVLLTSSKIDYKEYQKTWKNLKNSSERQYGAFMLLYLNHFGSAPVVFKDIDVKFRNDVVHKGKFPTSQETQVYAMKVLNYIQEVLGNLKGKYEEEINKVLERDIIYSTFAA